MSAFLDQAELVKLTGKRRPGAQVQALRKMGVHHFVRPDGHPVVPRSAIDGKAQGEPRVLPDFEPLTRAG